MERIYHPYNLWEDYKVGFYDNISGRNKQEMIESVVRLFSDAQLTEAYMRKVITDWPFSCEHNLSNLSMNRIAYLGQAACCIYAKVPSTITMEAWSKVDQKDRNKADIIAEQIIKQWEGKYA